MNKARTKKNRNGYYGYVHPITMKLVYIMGFFALLSLTSCDSDDDISPDFYIDILTMDNYPKVDGSTSAEPLQVLIACRLLEVDYSWVCPVKDKIVNVETWRQFGGWYHDFTIVGLSNLVVFHLVSLKIINIDHCV